MNNHQKTIEIWKKLPFTQICDGSPLTEQEMIASGAGPAAEIIQESRLPRNSSCLDFGCGIGRLTYHFANYFQSTTGIEPSDHFRAIAKMHGPYLVYKESLEKLDSWEKFDLIVVNLVFIHHEIEGIKSDLTALKKHMEPTGQLFFDLYVSYDINVVQADYRRLSENTDGSPICAVDGIELNRFLKQQGFIIRRSSSTEIDGRWYERIWCKLGQS